MLTPRMLLWLLLAPPPRNGCEPATDILMAYNPQPYPPSPVRCRTRPLFRPRVASSMVLCFRISFPRFGRARNWYIARIVSATESMGLFVPILELAAKSIFSVPSFAAVFVCPRCLTICLLLAAGGSRGLGWLGKPCGPAAADGYAP